MDDAWGIIVGLFIAIGPFLGLLNAAFEPKRHEYPPKGMVADLMYSLMGERPRKR